MSGPTLPDLPADTAEGSVGGAPPARPGKAPGLARRLAAFCYEGVLLFGVLMVAGLVYAGLTQQRHALHGKLGLQAFVFVVLLVYFAWFWSHGGQTVAMRAWHLRLVDVMGRPVGWWRASARYLLAWMWFVPALLTSQLAGLQGGGPLFGALLTGVLAYAALALLRDDRQFWHDVVCGTRLVHWQPPKLSPEEKAARRAAAQAARARR